MNVLAPTAHRYIKPFDNANFTGADLRGSEGWDWASIGGANFCDTKTDWGLDNSSCK